MARRFYLTRFGFLWSCNLSTMMHYIGGKGTVDLSRFKKIGRAKGILKDQDSGTLWCWRNDVFLLNEDDWEDDEEWWDEQWQRLEEFSKEHA